MAETIVDRLYKEFKDLVSLLDQSNEISLRSVVDENFRKSLLLAAASYFEDKITNDLLLFAKSKSNQNELLVSFVKNKAIGRQYHTLFNWRDKNANQFFGLFGDAFQAYMKAEIKNNNELDNSIKAFLELGNERNRLVHENFGSFSLEKTAEEIYQLYKTASLFVWSLEGKLNNCPTHIQT